MKTIRKNADGTFTRLYGHPLALNLEHMHKSATQLEWDNAKVRVENGKVFRKRRGTWVEIPTEWVGKTVGRQTIAARPSKKNTHRIRRRGAHQHR